MSTKRTNFATPVLLTKKGRIRATPFPVKLMEILSNPDYNDIIAWLPNGKSFRVLDPKKFTTLILPLHFKEAKYSSFKRKLYRWGFQRHRTTEGYTNPKGSWYGSRETFHHEQFQQNRVDLIVNMKRLGKKGVETSQDLPNIAGTEPPMIAPQQNLAGSVPGVFRSMATIPSSTAAFMPRPTSQLPLFLNNRMSTNEIVMNAAIELEVNRRLQQRKEVARALIAKEQCKEVARALIAKEQRKRLVEQYLSQLKPHTDQRDTQQDASAKAGADLGNVGSSTAGAPLNRLPTEKNVMPRTA